ncbi:MAG TPA: sulfotransferase [Chloroflexi bacterium]|nr:sulfotransferase [Chloroflexota bacterium]
MRRPILVTGAIRSGTTWVGRMIAASPQVGYIHEPLNPWEKSKNRGICDAPIPFWYFYITRENEAPYYQPIKRSLEFRYNLFKGLMGARSRADVRRILREYQTFRANRANNARPLVKDPFALFSAEWFAERFGAEVVILIRHPAAFVSSVKRLGWGFPFWHLLRQPLLLRDHLRPFEEQIKEYAPEKHPYIDQAALVWKMLYHVVLRYREKHEDWIFVRHEDLARDPMGGFRALFERLGLEFSPRVQDAVRRSTAASNPSEVPAERAFSIQRDSRASIWTWKKRLTAAEIQRIREATEEVAQAFYSDEDW